MTEFPLTGGCNCGAVRFEVTAPLAVASYCHCKRCQRRTGPPPPRTPTRRPARSGSSPARTISACGSPRAAARNGSAETCGSALFGRNPSHADPIGIRMGAFDADPGIRPTVRQFVRYAAPWEPVPDDGLPRFPESRHVPPGARPTHRG